MTQVIEETLDNKLVVALCTIKVNGTNLEAAIFNKLMSVEVQQSLYLPAMCTLHFFTPNLDLFETNPFTIGAKIVISMGHDGSSLGEVFNGEITSIEIDADLHMPTLTVCGYDKLHRLQRGRRTRTFMQVKDSDLVSQLAGEGSLSASATATSEVFDYIVQNNETDLEFLQRRAHRIGMELFADGDSLKFQAKSSGSSVATLTWGQSLRRFVSRLTSVSQVASVLVQGWDPKNKQAIVGTANSSSNHPTTGEGSKSQTYGGTFGTAKVASVYRPVTSQGEADKVAQAILDDLTGRFIQAEGSCIGIAAIKVGSWITIEHIGNKFGGSYYVTGCNHLYNKSGYETSFQADGRQTHTWLELTNQPGERGSSEAVNSLVVGLVSNNKDPKEMGRVKVKFPWLPEIESDWAAIATPMTGNGYGFMFLPEVNDEVLVGFERGDIQHPYIVGALWNGIDKPPAQAASLVDGAGKVKQRILKTRSGHIVTFDDSDDAPKITIVDKTAKNKITIDSTSNLITIESGEGNLALKATNGKISLEGQQIEIKGTTSAKINTATLEMVADTSAKMSSKQVQISADTTMALKATMEASLDGGKMLEVKGTLVKIN